MSWQDKMNDILKNPPSTEKGDTDANEFYDKDLEPGQIEKVISKMNEVPIDDTEDEEETENTEKNGGEE